MKTVINLLAFALSLVWFSLLVGILLVNILASLGFAVVGLRNAVVDLFDWRTRQAHRKWLRAETRPLRAMPPLRVASAEHPGFTVLPASSVAQAADNLPPVLPARIFDASDQTPDAVYCPQCVIEESHGWVYEPVGDPVYCVGHRYSTLAHAHRRLCANGGETA